MSDEGTPVAVSRRIAAPAADIFRILADPRRHVDLDGSGMLRGAVTEAAVTGVGDTATRDPRNAWARARQLARQP